MTTRTLGRNMLLAGLAIQLGVMACFIAFSLHLFFLSSHRLWAQPSWRPVFCALFGSMAALLARNIFRVCEYAGGCALVAAHAPPTAAVVHP